MVAVTDGRTPQDELEAAAVSPEEVAETIRGEREKRDAEILRRIDGEALIFGSGGTG